MASALKSNRCARLMLAGALTLGLAACSGQVTQHGYVASETALDQIQIGSSREQVDLVMGTPTTTGTVDGDAYYYISELREQTMFFAPSTIDRRVLVFYFGEDGRVARIANYGLRDGQAFDFISRTTPTMGGDRTFIEQLLGDLSVRPGM